MFGFLISFAISAVIAVVAYNQTRRLVSTRLRYVDAMQSPAMPLLIGGVVGLIAVPVAGLLPFVGVGTALTLGLSVGLGAAAGRNESRRMLPPAD